MKKNVILTSILALLVMGAAVGCDNRSQLEKDADKAAKELNKAAGDAQKKLGL
jgi:hypothetical protein